MRKILVFFLGLIFGMHVQHSEVYAGGYWASGRLINFDKHNGVLHISIMRLDDQNYDFLSQDTDVSHCDAFNLILMPQKEPRKFLGIVYHTRVIEVAGKHLETLESLENQKREIRISFIAEAGPLSQIGECDFETVVSSHTFSGFSIENPHITLGY